jgi:hypothetical protein
VTVPGPIIAASGPRRIGDNRTRCGADQAARDRTPYTIAGETADQRPAPASDQCATSDPVLPRSLTAGEHQGQRSHHENFPHSIPPSKYFDTSHASMNKSE